MSGTEAIREIMAISVRAKIIALTAHGGDQDIYRALRAGVSGYLLKEMVQSQVIDAIRNVYGGGQYLPAQVLEKLKQCPPGNDLTKREIDVLAGVAQGLRNGEIAHSIGTGEGTVKMHIQNILGKLGVRDRT